MRFGPSLSMLALSLGVLAGCGGGHSECKATVTGDLSYAGNYVITYTPSAGSGASALTFNVTVSGGDLPGYVSGTGLDNGTGKDVTLTATSGDKGGEPSFAGNDNQCDDKVYVRLVFTRSATTNVDAGAVIEELRASAKQTGSLAGTYQASNLLGGSSLSSGTLTVSAAVAQP